ncbi:MAG: hypothetical protein AVDCRST_MAG29-1010 [uncultured Nocardioidaceae bacterium]|uniref:Coenzyme Q-binding protein COQ10 START domain-containing protein n=1 Tax=uncultured Nocardioidaceae bacterium TaxID=253824 RepID=A0A6J4LFL5_9ACTN|nr:MAG: hypothetical protein AVDCRST_MAG29-1010 [uncultured Nocardioidaceae bacterium]
MTTNVEKTIIVDAPVSAVYNQWTQFEEFPEFMGGVQQVTQLTDDRLHWVAQIAGVQREWDAKILEQLPDTKVAWAATEGSTNAGAVTFTPMGATQTLVRLSLEFEPEGLVEKAGDALNIVGRQAESDLEKFKSWFEARGFETGGWRGAVNEGANVGTPGVESATSQGDSGSGGVSAKKVAGVVAGVAGAAGVAAAAKAASGGSSQTETTSTPVESVPMETVSVETTSTEPAQPVGGLQGAGSPSDAPVEPIPVDEYVGDENAVQDPAGYDDTSGRTV